jgi:TolB-like protein
MFRFADCLLDAERRELRRRGVLCPLEPQVFDLLEYLVRNRDRFVSKADVKNAVWGGRIVSEAALHTRVNAARNAIGDSGAKQRLIRTLRTRGFRFVGSVSEETRQNTRTAELSGKRPLLIAYPTIAVLPFANSAGQSQAYLADALTENLITALSRVGWLFVVPRISSFACNGLALGASQTARKLGVRYLLDGSIRQLAGRHRVTAQLIDGLSDFQIWTEHYEQDAIDCIAILEEICKKVVSTLEAQLFLAEHLRIEHKATADLNSWECIVRALSLMNSRVENNVVTARGLLQKAVSIDPQSVQGHSLLSIASTLLVHMSWGDRQNVIPSALASARRALSLNPDHPWAHAALEQIPVDFTHSLHA